MVFGTIIFVIPSAYIGREYRPQENKDPDMSLWEFYKRYMPDEFTRNGFEWLWFLVVLYLIQVANFPFMKLVQQIKRNQRIVFKTDWPLFVW